MVDLRLQADITQTLELFLSPRMLQMLKILHLPYTELVDQITKEAEENVTKKIEATVRDLCAHRGYPFNKRNFKQIISSTEVKDKPTCTLVAAVYESQDFDQSSKL